MTLLSELEIGNSYFKADIGRLIDEPNLVNQTKFSPGLFRCKNSNTIVLFVDLDKKSKEEKFRFNDYFDGDSFHWDSQPQQNIETPTIKSIVQRRNEVILFARVHQSIKGETQPFVYCGRLGYVTHDQHTSNPVHITFSVRDYLRGKTEKLDEVYDWSSSQLPRLARPLVKKVAQPRSSDNPKDAGSDLEVLIDEELGFDRIENGTEREALVKIRVKQGLFRKLLLERYHSKCCLTGISNPALLIASHIKPFAESNDYERVDPNNGLLLAAHIDALFDSFLISFYNDGTLIISDELSINDRRLLGLSKGMKLRFPLTDKNQEHLRIHRSKLK